MPNSLIVVLQIVGLAVMTAGALSSPTSHAMVVVGGLAAFVGGLEYRRRIRSE